MLAARVPHPATALPRCCQKNALPRQGQPARGLSLGHTQPRASQAWQEPRCPRPRGRVPPQGRSVEPGEPGPGSHPQPRAGRSGPRALALTGFPLEEPGGQSGGSWDSPLGALLIPVFPPVPQLRVDEAPHEPGLGSAHQEQDAEPAGGRAGGCQAVTGGRWAEGGGARESRKEAVTDTCLALWSERPIAWLEPMASSLCTHRTEHGSRQLHVYRKSYSSELVYDTAEITPGGFSPSMPVKS